MFAEYLLVGKIVRTQGLKGEVRVDPTTDNKDRFDKIKKVYIIQTKKGEPQKFPIEKRRYRKNQVVLKFKKVSTYEEARKMIGSELLIKRNQAKELPESTYFYADLLGMRVTTTEGRFVGFIRDILATGANDVYYVTNQPERSKKKSKKEKEAKDTQSYNEYLIPAIKEVIKSVNVGKNEMEILEVKGLLIPED